ncbi:MAG: hypothetical protein WCG34_12745 [Leptolinea sp.]
MFWQIWLPIGIGAVAFLALGVMAGFSLQTGTDSAARWGQIAVMWMILPVFAAGLISLILLLGLIFGVSKLIQILPKYSIIVQMFFQRITRVIRTSTNKSVQPVIIFRSNKAAVLRFLVAVQYSLFGGYDD